MEHVPRTSRRPARREVGLQTCESRGVAIFGLSPNLEPIVRCQPGTWDFYPLQVKCNGSKGIRIDGCDRNLYTTPTDPRSRLAPLSDPPSTLLHEWVRGLGQIQRRRAQATAFQLITGHAFHADYSLRLRTNAGDTTTCPEPGCSRPWTLRHYIEDCDRDWDLKSSLIPTMSLDYLLTTKAGGRQLATLLHLSGAFSRPLPRPDPH